MRCPSVEVSLLKSHLTVLPLFCPSPCYYWCLNWEEDLCGWRPPGRVPTIMKAIMEEAKISSFFLGRWVCLSQMRQAVRYRSKCSIRCRIKNGTWGLLTKWLLIGCGWNFTYKVLWFRGLLNATDFTAFLRISLALFVWNFVAFSCSCNQFWAYSVQLQAAELPGALLSTLWKTLVHY